MADYAKLYLKAVYSKNSDYSSPKATMAPEAYTLTPDEYIHVEVQADTGGTPVITSHLASVTALVIKNNDTTNYVKATWRSAEYDGSAVKDNQLRIAAGGLIVTTDFTAANSLILTANTAACECEVFIIGT